MSTITGPNAPRLPSSLATSTARPASATSFLSRVQATASGATSLPTTVSAPAVSGQSIVATAVASAKDAAAPAVPLDAQQQAVQEMTRSFLQSTMQSIFSGFGEKPGPELEQVED